MNKAILQLALIGFCFFLGCKDDKININEPVYLNNDRIVFVSMSDLDDPNSVTNLFSVNLDGNNIKQLTNGINISNNNPVVSYDGTKIIYQSYRNGLPNIFSINTDGTNIVNLTNDSTYDFYPQISVDNCIVFQRGGTAFGGKWIRPHICKMNIDGSNRINIMDNLMSLFSPRINSKTRQIYFIGMGNNTSILYCADYDGKNQRALTDSSLAISSNINDYTISNDGSKIAFVAFNKYTNQQDLFVMNTNGTGLLNVTQNSETESNPSFSRDNQEIVYDISGHSGLGGKRPIKIVPVNGGTQKIIVNMEKANEPVYSLSGDKILFIADNDGAYDIYSVDRDGNNLFNITKSKNDEFYPQIVP